MGWVWLEMKRTANALSSYISMGAAAMASSRADHRIKAYVTKEKSDF